MTTQAQIDQMAKIAGTITHGNLSELDNLLCPYCSKSDLGFSFTVKRAPAYGLYVFCRSCKQVSHFHLTGKPPNFREDLVIASFQEIEEKVERWARNEP